MIRLKFKNPMHYILVITVVFGFSFASLFLLEDLLFGDPLTGGKKNFYVHDIVRFYIISLIGGLIISIFSLPFYSIGSKQEASISSRKETNEKLKRIVFSNYFFIIVFCFVSTLRIVFAKIFNEVLMVPDVALSYFFAFVVGFCFPRLILLGERLWKKIALDNREVKQTIPTFKGVILYVYCVGLLGCVYIILGFGTFGFIFTRYICIVSYDTLRLALDMCSKVLPVGICCGNICYFYVTYNRFKHNNK
jgi:hypothetical protein